MSVAHTNNFTADQARLLVQAMYRDHANRLRAFVRRRYRHMDQAAVDDIVHDVFVEACSKVVAGKFDCTFSTWKFLWFIVKQRLRRWRATAARERPIEVAEDQEDPAVPVDTAFDEASQLADLQRAIAQLDQDDVHLITLAFVEGHSVPEVAAALGVPENTVKTRQHRVKKRLRKALQSVQEDRAIRQIVDDVARVRALGPEATRTLTAAFLRGGSDEPGSRAPPGLEAAAAEVRDRRARLQMARAFVLAVVSAGIWPVARASAGALSTRAAAVATGAIVVALVAAAVLIAGQCAGAGERSRRDGGRAEPIHDGGLGLAGSLTESRPPDAGRSEVSTPAWSRTEDPHHGVDEAPAADLQPWREVLAGREVVLYGGNAQHSALGMLVFEPSPTATRLLSVSNDGAISFGRCHGRADGHSFVARCDADGATYLLVGRLHTLGAFAAANGYRIVDVPPSESVRRVDTVAVPIDGLLLVSPQCPAPAPAPEWAAYSHYDAFWWTDIDAARIASRLCDRDICPATRFVPVEVEVDEHGVRAESPEPAVMLAFDRNAARAAPCEGTSCSFPPEAIVVGPEGLSAGMPGVVTLTVPTDLAETLPPAHRWMIALVGGVATLDGALLLQQGRGRGIPAEVATSPRCPTEFSIGAAGWYRSPEAREAGEAP